MSYQVLARKWRPAKFTEMVGQEHVLKALVNALDDDRLHHAYLFTGTRGVGKTSIARLFAKSLNCETGVSSTPCGQCSACQEISEGRFIDLIEVDAASRTKVEDTRELLENVQYAPTHGRFKVYLIDEVHMLSSHSFNALLKTLEEPPPHVKFLLATTDPQKLPVTILSRCLQFNLKNMIPERIVEHLCRVLTAENIKYEEPALWLLARSADGSMRDALSLTDQAIAFGAGQVVEADVRAMLGTIDQRLVYLLVDSLASHDAKALLATVDELARFSPDYNVVLGDLISLMHRIALAQIVPDAVDNGLGDRELLLDLAAKLTAEDVQLFYQTALMGRKDLPFVPDAREGLEMTLMRMLAFRPVTVSNQGLSEPVDPEPSVTPDLSKEELSKKDVPTEPIASPIAAPETVAASTPEPLTQPKVMGPEPELLPQSESQTTQQDGPPDYDESYLQAGYEDQPGKKPEVDLIPPVGAGLAPASSEISRAESEIASDMPVKAVVDLPWEDNSAVEPANSEIKPQVESVPEQASATVQPQTASRNMVVDITPVEEIVEPDAKVNEDISLFSADQWVLLVELIGLSGMTYSIASNTSLESVEGDWRFHYTSEQKAMISEIHTDRIRESIGHYFNTSVEVEFSLGDYSRETPSQYRDRKRAERQVEAVSSIQNDPVVQRVIERFSGSIDLESVQPID